MENPGPNRAGLFRLLFPGLFVVISFAGCTGMTPLQKEDYSHVVIPRHVNGSQPIAFRRVILDIPAGKIIGSHHAGLLRASLSTYSWERSGGIVGPESFNVEATEELRRSGFDVLGEGNQVFGEDTSYKARYQLGATIKDLAFNTYDPMAGNFSEASVKVEWLLQDAYSRQIISTYTNSGYGKLNGVAPGVLPRAFRDALMKMIATSRMPDLVAKGATNLNQAPSYSELINVTVARPALPRSLPDDMDKVMLGVVVIRAGEVTGNGVVVSSDGYILTAAHVVSGTKEVAVRFKSGLQLNASVIRVDPEQDIALIRIPGSGHQAVELNLDAPDKVGSELYAIGVPLGEELAFTVTKGVISGYREREGDKARFIQTDASLNPGNSGGPLLNKSGKVIGIVSYKIVLPGFEGLAFGVPVDVIAKRLGIVWTGATK